MPQSRPSSAPEAQPSQPAAAPPSPEPDAAAPAAPEEGAIFHALRDAGADEMAAYTADQRIRTMISEAVAPQIQPFLVEIRRRFDDLERRLDRLERKLDALAEGAAERDRRLDVLVARVDALKALVQVVFGALAILITVLLAVFGFLFTN